MMVSKSHLSPPRARPCSTSYVCRSCFPLLAVPVYDTVVVAAIIANVAVTVAAVLLLAYTWCHK